jgi:preprotein translocase subunit YajC
VSNGVGPLLPLVLLLVVGYLLLVRLPRKRAREVSELQAALNIGDQIMLTSGIFGRVDAMVEEKVDVEISPGVVITVHRGAVGKIVRDVTDDAPEDDLGQPDPAGPDGDPSRGAV